MLSLLPSRIQPESEAIDRDPGIVTLLARVAASLRRGSRSGLARLSKRQTG